MREAIVNTRFRDRVQAAMVASAIIACLLQLPGVAAKMELDRRLLQF